MEIKTKEVLIEVWISKDRFVELEEKYKKLEEKCDRIERILEYSDEPTCVCTSYINSEYYLYLDGKEYELKIPSDLNIYYLDKTNEDKIVKVKCYEKLCPWRKRYYLFDLKSGEKIEVNSEDTKI